ncbi:OmpA family protein [Pseudooceanicola sp. HF7]|uniref:OmpA family protein n=1 Tax=Pseudooceanicola sp. HF7 TaxID=2721560 RepID=UPI001430E0FF|nr:OmpA family protein [Pseudooceanicola sp. HF7]NIZ09337.1 OmpA family protein [Pseudooceanicola sp. HF7]
MTRRILKSTTAIALSITVALPGPVLAQADATGQAQVQAEGQIDPNLADLTPEERQKLLEEQAEAAQKQALDDAVAETVQEAEPEAGAETAEVPATEAPEAEAAQDTAQEAPQADAPADTAATATDEQPAGAQAAESPATEEDPVTSEGTTQAEADAPSAAETSPKPKDPSQIAAETDAATGDAAEADTTSEASGEIGDTGDAAPETTPRPPETEAVEQAQQPKEDPAATETELTQEQVTAAEDDTAVEAEATTEVTADEAATEDSATAEASDQSAAEEATPLTEEEQRAKAEAEAASQESRQEERVTSAAAAADAEAEDVVTETVTEETARSSDEEFSTKVNESTSEDKGSEVFETIGKAALAGLGAYAVGSLLNNGDKVVSNSGDRVVLEQDDGRYVLLKDDDTLLRQPGSDVRTEAFNDGSTRSTVTREDGTQIVTVRAADGTVLRRSRVLPNGEQVVLFDDTRTFQSVNVRDLPQAETKSIDYRNGSVDDLEAALERAAYNPDRAYSLSQIRDIGAVRKLVPEIAVEGVNFATGSAVIRPEEARDLAALGKAMSAMIAKNPGEVFLVEGHTDAVGQASYNLALSDRRAESLALALTEYFDVPPENMVVQGYGESDLKVQTSSASEVNRRAAVRRVTALLNG